MASIFKINSTVKNIRVADLERELRKSADKRTAAILQRFFKTGPGQYGAGDVFLGLKVPLTRRLAVKYANLPLSGVQRLLDSKFHEFRLAGLLILVSKYEALGKKNITGRRSARGKTKDQNTASQKQVASRVIGGQKEIVDFYLKNARCVNNWDLVDLSVYKILGDFLLRQTKGQQRETLDKLTVSDNIWERRMAMVATYAFIKSGEVSETFRVAKRLLRDEHDLIHKAVGWMLREAGKRIEAELKIFLNQHYKHMPRTALRYAIERLSQADRKYYLKR